MNDVVIHVDALSKRFTLQGRGAHTLKGTALEALRYLRGQVNPASELWALSQISFDVRRGEVLGIIGANGAGKSTLLGLLAGTMAPTSGTVTTTGTISSLLELGAGFHPDLTGRENVFLAGATMGLTRRQMKDRLPAIIEYAELESFIDQPVKHYSSGMYVRLGFAVAVEVNPDILLIDEVLAVGDAAFQRKCIKRMEEFRSQKKTMLIISHDLATIQSISSRILFLDHGTLQGDGPPSEMIDAYETFWRNKASDAAMAAASEHQREWGTREVIIEKVDFLDTQGHATDTFRWGEPLKARIRYRAAHHIDNPVFGFAISDQNGKLVHGNNTQIERFSIDAIDHTGDITLTIDPLPLAQGVYLFSFSVHSSDHRVNYHRIDNAYSIKVISDKPFEGCCYMVNTWSRT